MKKKLLLMLLIIVLTIGYAGVNTNLFVEVYSSFAFNESDLKVYFSGAYLDDEDYSNEIISEDKSMITISEVSALSKISYDITNASKEYDAIVNVECTSSTGGITFTNEDENLLISAREVGVSSTNVSGTVTNSTVTCKLKVKASGRTTSSNKTLANADEYVIYGTLKDSGGGALANSNVVIYSEEPHYVTTDEEGYLFYNGLEKGAHEIYYVNDTLENIKKMSKEQVKSVSTVNGRFTTSSSGTITLTNGSISSFGSMEVTPFCESLVGTTWNYDYTGSEQDFLTFCNGNYKFELWGAQGNNSPYMDANGGLGAYTVGGLLLTSNVNLYLYVGEHRVDSNISYNCGSSGGVDSDTTSGSATNGYGGGGATDIRLINGEWDNFESLKSRIVVAAGGGGGTDYKSIATGGYGGALIGGSGENAHLASYYPNIPPTGGSQIDGGTPSVFEAAALGKGSAFSGLFGKGGNGNAKYGSAGGGGYYGGAGGGWTNGSVDSGAGGSSFISGYTGCDAITESSTEDNIIHTGQPNHYSGYVFSNAQMIAGNETMPTHDGTGIMTGNSGNGYAKITFVSYEK